MKDEIHIDLEAVQDRPVFTLSCREFFALQRASQASISKDDTSATAPQAIGIAALARALSCSPSQIANMRRAKVLDDAIISRFGRNIVFDVAKARAAANEWMSTRDGDIN